MSRLYPQSETWQALMLVPKASIQEQGQQTQGQFVIKLLALEFLQRSY